MILGIFVQIDPILLVVRHIVLGINGLHRAFRHASITVDAGVGIDQQPIRRLVECLHRAHIHTTRVNTINASSCYNKCHDSFYLKNCERRKAVRSVQQCQARLQPNTCPRCSSENRTKHLACGNPNTPRYRRRDQRNQAALENPDRLIVGLDHVAQEQRANHDLSGVGNPDRKPHIVNHEHHHRRHNQHNRH
mgnify:CR=1 FL=1